MTPRRIGCDRGRCEHCGDTRDVVLVVGKEARCPNCIGAVRQDAHCASGKVPPAHQQVGGGTQRPTTDTGALNRPKTTNPQQGKLWREGHDG